MTESEICYLKDCRKRYQDDLENDIMPFWLKHGLDKINGGIYTCLDRDGTLMDRTKSVWFQGRFAFICAFAYNNIRKNPEWLEASRQTLDFIEKHCFDSDGHMFFLVTAEGSPVQKRRYVFSECFAIIAFAEYSLATGDKTYAQKALDVYLNTLKMLETPGFLPPKMLVPGRSHSITMMFLNVIDRLRNVTDYPGFEEKIDVILDDLKKYFMKQEYRTILENVGPDGEFLDTISGRTINPGHCIETSWFILNEARHRGNDKSLIEMGQTIFDWAWKWGWDEEFGGIINFRDCKGFPSQDYSQDMKFWWPQCEAIIGSLYLYLMTKDEKYLEIHKEINDYAFSHFNDPEYGEWFGYLHRDGTVAQPAKGNYFKGPFHIPRMMTISTLLCDEILKGQK